jgi:hypothetical protein
LVKEQSSSLPSHVFRRPAIFFRVKEQTQIALHQERQQVRFICHLRSNHRRSIRNSATSAQVKPSKPANVISGIYIAGNHEQAKPGDTHRLSSQTGDRVVRTRLTQANSHLFPSSKLAYIRSNLPRTICSLSIMSVPKTMKAITINGSTAKLVLDRAVPSPRPDQLLVKVKTVALNPTDWKHIAGKRAPDGGLSGCDYAGEVVEVGDKVNKPFKKGQRIAGVAHGANYSNVNDGVFAEYAVVKGDLQIEIPDDLSYEKAATFPLGLFT